MHRKIAITEDSIDETALTEAQVTEGVGAVVRFLGLVRGTESGAPISALEYEAFKPMVEHQFNLLLDQMEGRWPIESVRIVHRVGRVAVREASLWVEVTAPHRAEAFAACQWLIDEMKRVVPIWKKAAP